MRSSAVATLDLGRDGILIPAPPFCPFSPPQDSAIGRLIHHHAMSCPQYFAACKWEVFPSLPFEATFVPRYFSTRAESVFIRLFFFLFVACGAGKHEGNATLGVMLSWLCSNLCRANNGIISYYWLPFCRAFSLAGRLFAKVSEVEQYFISAKNNINGLFNFRDTEAIWEKDILATPSVVLVDVILVK